MKNTYEYRIYQNVYDEMISGRKNIEIRLLNEKTEKIKIGDIIKFKVLNNDKYLTAEVTNKYIYGVSIDELWKNKGIVLNSAINYTKDEIINILYEIFGKEKVLNSKIVGIEFKINNDLIEEK